MNPIERSKNPYSQHNWQNIAAILFCVLFAILFFYCLIKHAFVILLPFILAWSLALIIDPISDRLVKKTIVSKKVISCVLMALLLTLLFSLLTLAINRLVYEAEELLDWLASDSARLGSTIAELFNKITSFGDRPIPLIENLMKIEQFRQFWENIDVVISDMISESVSSLTKSIPVGVLHVISKLPSIILFVVITIISAFYFSLDLGAINAAVASVLPSKIREKLPGFKKKVFGTAAKYIRAYLLLLLLTFCELFVGFSILKIPYPLLLALLIALVDILPILGVGAVLVPWGLFEIILFKDHFTGAGLLIIYVIVAVIRQITEPKVVAGSLGLHPLLTLAAMYIGLKVFGIPGMILGPIFLLAIRPILKKAPIPSQKNAS